MAITHVNVGTFAQTNTASGTNQSQITPGLPSGVQEGDLLLALIAAGGDIVTSTITGMGTYALRGSELWVDYGAGGMFQAVCWKFAGASESATQFTVTCETSTGGGLWGAVAAFRASRGFPADPFDLASPSQGQTYPSPGTSTTFTPPSVTPLTAGSCVISFVTTSDDNALALSVGNEAGFTITGIAGAGYDSTLGSDGALGVAYKTDCTGETTICTWNQTLVGPDYWSYQTVAIKENPVPAVPFLTRPFLRFTPSRPVATRRS